ncbi:hypothetical protein [Algoriphagus namhaensis]
MIQEELKLYLKRLFPLVLIFVGIPLLSYLTWLLYPKTNLNVLVVDKTVPGEFRQEHHAFFWILEHLKFVKQEGKLYSSENDYLGFYPEQNTSALKVQGLEGMNDTELKSLAASTDFIFFSDTYGVYANDFNPESTEDFSEKIYGGLSQNDIDLLRYATEENQTIVAEFNTMASPTPKNIRTQFENIMGLKWTGWIGRYYERADTLYDDNVPQWFLEEYQAQHDGQTLSPAGGIIFVHEDGRVFAIQTGEDYENDIPLIKTQPINKHGFDLPELIPYPDWFDIVLIERSYEVISYYDINPTVQGMAKLREMGLPRFFPAAVRKDTDQGEFYYLAGDFTDVREGLGSARFTGLPALWRGWHLLSNYKDRKSFFWNYYYPLMSQIVKKSENRKK